MPCIAQGRLTTNFARENTNRDLTKVLDLGSSTTHFRPRARAPKMAELVLGVLGEALAALKGAVDGAQRNKQQCAVLYTRAHALVGAVVAACEQRPALKAQLQTAGVPGAAGGAGGGRQVRAQVRPQELPGPPDLARQRGRGNNY
mgnify:CR=1 FL=1